MLVNHDYLGNIVSMKLRVAGETSKDVLPVADLDGGAGDLEIAL